MMRRKQIALTLALVLATPTAANAKPGDPTVQSLLQECSAEEGSTDWFKCVGYIAGVSDIMGINGKLSATFGKDTYIKMSVISMCWDGEVPTYGAKLQAFKNWAQNHPEEWSELSFVGVTHAMRETWPCKY
jgi:hypothetical protein